MKHPNTTYDWTMLKEEPLSSFLLGHPLVHDENDPEFKEDRRKLALELETGGNVEAVRTWLNYAFEAHLAPPGKGISNDASASDLFIIFHWKLRQSSAVARQFLERERVKRGWPAKVFGLTPLQSASTFKTDLTGRDKLKNVKTETAVERKPIIPSISHVTRNKFSDFRFSKNNGSVSRNTSQQETNQITPQFFPSFSPSTISDQSNSPKDMQDLSPVPDTRASSPLSECESDWSVKSRALETKTAAEVPPGTSASRSNTALPSDGKVVALKPKHITARVKRKDRARSGERRISARLNASLSKQSSTTTNITAHDKSPVKKLAAPKQKTSTTNPKGVDHVELAGPAAIEHQSVTVKMERLDPQIAQIMPSNSGDSKSVGALSGKEGQQSNFIAPKKAKISFKRPSQNTLVAISRPKLSSRNKQTLAGNSRSSKSASTPTASQRNASREDKGEFRNEEQRNRRNRLRPRILDSSGNPTHVSPIQIVEKSAARLGVPLKRATTETFNPNKKQKLSKNSTLNVQRQKKLNFPVVKRARSSDFSGKPSLKTKDTRFQKKVAPKTSIQQTPNLGVKEEGSHQVLHSLLGSEAPSTVKGTTSLRKRKRVQEPLIINNNVQSPEKIDHLDEEPPPKKWRGRTRLSLKTIDKISDDNKIDPPLENKTNISSNPNTSLLPKNPAPFVHSEVEITTDLSATIFNPEHRMPTPPQTMGVVLPSHPETDFREPPSTIHPHTTDAKDERIEITKSMKEEIVEASVLPESRTSLIYNFPFQEYDEEIDPLPSEDLLLVEDLDKQFTYPEEHPDHHCRFPKPPLDKLPPIWAESRQELCESFDWFRSYQGGVYHAHNMTKGYLLSGFPASRDRFEHGGRLIISHGGGKAESIHCHKGRLESQPATDQLAQDKSVRALFDNFVNNRPLALVMDDRYALFPYDLRAKNVTYAVLGFYTIAHAWAEYQSSNNETGRVIRYKFAFRWCDDQGPPWWEQSLDDGNDKDLDTDVVGQFDSMMISGSSENQSASLLPPDTQKETSASDELQNEGKILSLNKLQAIVGNCLDRQCSSCLKTSLQVFSVWTCLHPQCFAFWKSGDGRPLPISMGYNPQFLKLCPSKPIPAGFGKLEPQMILDFSLTTILKTMYASTRGFHCLNCGRLSCRDKWEKLQCASCNFIMKISGNPRAVDSLLYQTPTLAFKDYALNPISDFQQLPPASFKHDKGRGVLQTFVLPYKNAKIHHIKSGNFLGRQEPDSIFIDYQEQATSGKLLFRRWPMRAHKCRSELLVLFQDLIDLSRPWIVVNELFFTKHEYFNSIATLLSEVLKKRRPPAGVPYKYVGGDENTVPFAHAPGAVVRARDLIQRRVEQALHRPVEFNEVLRSAIPNLSVIPIHIESIYSAAYMERQKMAFHSDDEVGLGPLVAGLSLGSPAIMHFRLLAKHDIEREKRGILLSIVLRHGDILVMDGAAVQEYYEHTVVPTNFRIAATARYIGADHA